VEIDLAKKQVVLMQFYFELAKGSLQTLEDLLALAWLYGQK
jgi:hypothetical protein